jgi:hypothetical protein
MPVLTTIPTGGTLEYHVNQPITGYRRGIITERVTGTGYSPSLTLVKQIPAGARILMASMKAATAIPIRLGSSAVATAGQAGAAMIIGTAPTALTTSLTTANWVLLTAQSAFAANLAENAVGSRAWNVTSAATNGLILPTTLNLPATPYSASARSVYVVPFAATTAAEAAQRFQVGTSTAATVATTGYTFGTSTSDSYSFDVQIVFDELIETPDQ